MNEIFLRLLSILKDPRALYSDHVTRLPEINYGLFPVSTYTIM
jgi:hypothetical protein